MSDYRPEMKDVLLDAHAAGGLDLDDWETSFMASMESWHDMYIITERQAASIVRMYHKHMGDD